MAYSTSNPPRCLAQSVGADGGSLWYYSSSDTQATINTAGYFSNGYDLGMRAGDIVFHVDPATGGMNILVVNAATESQVDVTDGLAVAATDTD